MYCKKIKGEEKLFLEIWQNWQENTPVPEFHFNKVAGWQLQLYEKRDSDTGVFL